MVYPKYFLYFVTTVETFICCFSLVYSVVPASIADDLRHKRNVPSLRYDDVTVLFSAIEGFSEFCATHRPIEIVELLNTCHGVFDTILNPKSHPEVYKVLLCSLMKLSFTGVKETW